MRLVHLAAIAALVLGFATSASAGKGATLAPGGNTVAGPGTFASATGDGATVFEDSDGSADVCVTVANTSKGAVNATVTLTGDVTEVFGVVAGQVRSACVQNVDTVDIACSAGCSAEWRVDDY
jgi:hypothetical protein